jgi:nucleotide-binding universal stress UspA family protein
MKILLAVDGSPISTRAVRHAIKLAKQLTEPAELVLFHADPPLLQAVAVKLGVDAVHRYHAENGRHATKAARAALTRAHVPFTELLVVGEPAEAIVRRAAKGRVDLIVMGTHGHGALQGLLLGSVAAKVIAHGNTPVTVVR